MTTFPTVRVLDAIAGLVAGNAVRLFDRTVFVCGQHLLETTGSLMDALIHCGAKPEHVFMLGKHYSTNQEVVDRLRASGITVIPGSRPDAPGHHGCALQADVRELWRQVYDRCHKLADHRVIVVDDGAHCMRSVPDVFKESWRIYGVEQTTSGLTTYGGDRLRFPVVAVAASALKRCVEPPQIADAVVRRTERILGVNLDTVQCGILGLGSIGTALARALSYLGAGVAAYDRDDKSMSGVRAMPGADELLGAAEVVFGCTGDPDCLPLEGISKRSGSIKVLASCSSSDLEFRAILRSCDARPIDPGICPTLAARAPGRSLTFKILRSGFPVNFDNSRESVPADQIQLTRGLMFSGIIQAALAQKGGFSEEPELAMLDPEMQALVFRAWAATASSETSREDCYQDPKWLSRHSQGRRWPRSATNLLISPS